MQQSICKCDSGYIDVTVDIYKCGSGYINVLVDALVCVNVMNIVVNI